MFSSIPTLTIITLVISGIITVLSFIPKVSKTPAIAYLANFIFLLLFIVFSLIWKFNDGPKIILWHHAIDGAVLVIAVIFMIRAALNMMRRPAVNNDIAWDVKRR